MQRLKRIEMLVAVLVALSGWTGTAQTVHFSGAQTTVTSQVVAPGRLAVDAAGDIYVTDSGSGLVLKETLTAGTYQQSVIPTSALLQPYGVAVDAKGNVYVNDSGHNRVLEESPSAAGYQESVFATSAVSGPRCIFADAAGNVWICDTGNNRLLKETPAGVGYVETVVGNGMNRPAGAAEDGQGNVYVSDFGNGRILKEAPSGNSYKQTVVTTAKMGNPSGIAVDGAGNLYVSTDALNMVMKETLTSTGSYVQSVVASSNLNYPDGIALDAAGNLVIADTLNRRVLRQQVQGAEFGAAATGAVASGAGQSLVFTFDTAGTLAVAPVISRQGMQTADFVVANTSTCVPGQSYAVSASCTVDVTFTPTMVGSVSGAAVLESSAGGLLATGFMHGTGTGPLVSFAPPSETVVGSGFTNPRSVFADAAGNVYVADTDNQRIVKETLAGGTYTQSVVPTSALQWPLAVAVDGNGNVYVSDTWHSREIKESIAPGMGGAAAATPVENVIVSKGLNYPAGIALDGAGNFYLADSVNNRILMESPASASATGYVANTLPITGLSNVYGVAVDATGNLYIADSGNNRILKETRSAAGSFTYAQTVIPTSTLAFPRSVAVDANGDLYICDTNNGRVVEEVWNGAAYTENVVRSGLASPDSVALDGSGNLYIADTANQRVLKETFATPPSLQFASTAVGSTSASQQVSVSNVGNTALSFPSPYSGSSPAISVGFSANAGVASACPATSAGHDPGADLAAGGTCVLSISFTPTFTGVVQGYLVLSDTNLNDVSALQTVSLWGSATADIIKLALSAPSSSTYGNAVQVTAQLSNSSNQDAVGAGSVGFADQTGTFGTQPVAGGQATQSYLAATVGTAVLKAIYTPSDLTMDSAQAQVKMRVLPAPLTASVVNASRTYGAPNPVFTGQVLGAVNGDSFQESFTTAASGRSAVGLYPIVPSVSGNGLSNYTVANQDGQLTITAAQVSAKANDATRVYGGANPVFTGAVSGAVNGDVLTGTYTTTATAASAPGTYSIVPAVSGASAGNYTPVLQNGTLTVTAAQVSAKANDATRVYGAANPVFTGTVSGAVNGDVLTGTYTTTATAASAPGTYSIVPAVSGASAGNYTPVLQNGTLTITAAQVSVKANDATRVYGAPNPVFTGTVSGAVNGDVLTGTYTTTATAASAPGTYSIVPAVSGASAGNYTPVLQNGTLTITAAQVSAKANDATRVYGGANPVFTGAVSGAVNGDVLTGTYTTTATAASAPGTYSIVPAVSGASAGNYTPVLQNGTLTVTAAQVSAKANDATRVYGAANPVFTGTVSGAVNGDVLTGTYTTTATAASAPGTYSIVPAVSGASAGNYTPVLQNGTLTITALQVSVKANDATRVYGAANPVFTGTVTGAVNGDVLTGTYTTTATAASAPGTYSIVPTVSGASAGNYTPVLQNGTLTITAAQVNAKANDATRVYGAANPEFTGAVTGAVNGDVLTGTYTTTATAASAPGTYSIVPTVSGASAGNYTPVLQNGTLTITAAQVSAKANDATRVYGGANPVFTGAVTGAVNGDVLTETFTTSATPASAPGTYAIVPVAEGTNLANYTQTVIDGTLTIQPSTLAVSAQDQARFYGEANPVFSGSITGAAAQDSFTESFTTNATPTSAVGSYAIVPTAAGSTLADYSVSTKQGALTVKPAPLKVSADNVSRSYGVANPQLTGRMQGVVNGDALQVVFSTQADAQTSPGTYPIEVAVSGAALGNYAVVATDGVMTINALSTTTTLTQGVAGTSGAQTLQAVVAVSGSTIPALPTGSVRFYAGKAMLAEVPLVQGAATWTGAVSSAGQGQTLTAVYQGDANCLPSASAGLVLPPDTTGFWIKPLGDLEAGPVQAGQQTAYALQAGPGPSGLYPGTVVFAVRGLPAGATATFSPAKLEATSGVHSVTMNVTLGTAAGTTTVATAGHRVSGAWLDGLGEAMVALVLLPLAGARRLRRAGGSMKLLCLLLAACVTALALTGCGVVMGPGLGKAPNPAGSKPMTYTLTVVMMTGGQQVSMEEALVVQQP